MTVVLVGDKKCRSFAGSGVLGGLHDQAPLSFFLLKKPHEFRRNVKTNLTTKA